MTNPFHNSDKKLNFISNFINVKRQLLKNLFTLSTKTTAEPIRFYDSKLGVSRRYYAQYEEYIEHQAEKIGKLGKEIIQSDHEYETIVVNRYGELIDFRGKSILCLGARMGGEVRAFKKLGALAVGIDLEPSAGNCHVLHGDFHDILFPDDTFDFAFSNSVDHVFNLNLFVSEVNRVLKPEGCFLLELAQVKPGNYEVLDTSNLIPILDFLKNKFEVIAQKPITNKTNYINWEGLSLQLRKIKVP
jgi:SAM-dependent methyltransferase